MATKKSMRKLMELASEFVIKHEGVWAHEEWETLLKKAEKSGALSNGASAAHLGASLEGAKSLYFELLAAESRKVLAKEEKKARKKARKAPEPMPGAVDTDVKPRKAARKKECE